MIVVGGGGGLGRAVAQALSRAGYRMVVTSRREAPVACAGAVWYRWQPGDDPAPLVEQLRDGGGILWGLVYAVGPFGRRRSVAEVTRGEWDRLLAANASGLFAWTRAVVPVMRGQGGGRIVALTAVGAGTAAGWSGRGPYMAAKAAATSLIRTIAREEEAAGILANAVAPSWIPGPAKEAPDAKDAMPAGYDVARLVAFLLDPAVRHLTGQVLELSFGAAVGLPALVTSLPWPDRLEPLGKTVWPGPWRQRGWRGTIVDRTVFGGSIWYLVDGPPGRTWFPAVALAGVPAERAAPGSDDSSG